MTGNAIQFLQKKFFLNNFLTGNYKNVIVSQKDTGGDKLFKRLRELRKSQGYTCEQMATKLGLSKGTYSKKERGLIVITLNEAQKIAAILNDTVDKIFFENQVSF